MAAEDVRFPGTRVTGTCELSKLGLLGGAAGAQGSSLQSHLSSLSPKFFPLLLLPPNCWDYRCVLPCPAATDTSIRLGCLLECTRFTLGGYHSSPTRSLQGSLNIYLQKAVTASMVVPYCNPSPWEEVTGAQKCGPFSATSCVQGRPGLQTALCSKIKLTK